MREILMIEELMEEGLSPETAVYEYRLNLYYQYGVLQGFVYLNTMMFCLLGQLLKLIVLKGRKK